MEKDPEITVITALLGVLASYEWKKLSDCAQLRVLEVFHARRCEDQASKCQKPAPPEQKIKPMNWNLTVTDSKGQQNLGLSSMEDPQ